MQTTGLVHPKCPWCSHMVRRGSADWDEAVKFGRCTKCKKFFETAREERVAALLRDPAIVGEVRRKRLRMFGTFLFFSVIVGAGALAFAVFLKAGLLVVIVGPGIVLGMMSGLAALSVALRLTPEREARLRVEGSMTNKSVAPFLMTPGADLSGMR